MDIKQSFEVILGEIEAEKVKVAELAQVANKTLEEATKAKKEADEAKEEAEKKIKELADYERTQEYVNDLTSTDRELNKRKVELAEKHNKLVRWENKLVEIEARQKTKEEELKTKGLELTKEKETYKETLKEEFIKQLEQTLK